MAQSNFPSISTQAEVYTVSVGTESTDMKLINGTVQAFIIRNVGEFPIYIKYGEGCNSVIHTHVIKPNAFFADDYGGLITGCVDLYRTSPGLVLITLKL